MPFKPGQSGNPRGRPAALSAEEQGAKRRAYQRERYRARQAMQMADEGDLPAVDDDDLAVTLPEIDAYSIAKAMRLAGLQAAQFAQKTMHDEGIDVKYRLAAASLLAARGWMDAPRDPAVLVQNNVAVFDRERAEQVLARLTGRAPKVEEV